MSAAGPTTVTAPATVIEVFADVVCPFTHVGLKRFLARRREAGRDDVRLRLRAWPLEVVNGAPLAAEFVREEIDVLREVAAPDLFAGFRADAFPATTIPALALTAAAYDVSDDLGERVGLELRDLLFEQGRDLGDATVLEGVASRAGLEPADPVGARRRVLAEHAEGVRRGVIGSPHFFTPRGDFFCPALDISRDSDGHLHVAADPGAFDTFLTACFDS